MIGTSNKLITYLIEQAKDKQFELKEYRQKRSKDANAYCWILCDNIAKAITTPESVVTKEVVYKDAILQIGTFEPMIIEEKAFNKFKDIWQRQGLGYLVKEVSKKDKSIYIYFNETKYLLFLDII